MIPTASYTAHTHARTALAEVVAGLSSTPRTLPCKYFYDEHGSRLFDQICLLPEYYQTRTEQTIMQLYGTEMAAFIGRGCALVEFGSGSSTKTRILLDCLPEPAAYLPVDISREHLYKTSAQLENEYPGLPIVPVCADYTHDIDLAGMIPTGARIVVYFPGSTIGNFEPTEAVRFLGRIAGLCGPDGGLLIGVDRQKEISVLEAAYNDASGVTAAFNLNLLTHLNGLTGADFNVDHFAHTAGYNVALGRIEMHLISLKAQEVHVGDHTFFFRKGENIHTESSYKYTLPSFEALAAQAGWTLRYAWSDPRDYFSVLFLEPG